jgi:predicted metal-dependent hydrolase
MNPQRIRHRVIRTRNKHSRAVYRDGQILIRLAQGLSKAEAREHVMSLLERMREQVAVDNKKILIDPFRPLLTGAESLTVRTATGKAYHFRLRPGARTRARRTRTGWNVEVGPSTRRTGLHRFLWKLLSHSEENRIRQLVHRINNETFREHVRDVRLSFALSQWGSCSHRRVIMLNTALLFAPPSVLRYVIIHELAHILRADHSQRYWHNVSWAMPTYERALETLKEHRLPTL